MIPITFFSFSSICFIYLAFVKQSVLATDIRHSSGHVKVVCQKDNGEFLHKSFFDTTFFHGSMKAINLIYSVHIKAVNLIYLYTGASHVYYLSVPNSLFCSYAQFLFIPFKAHKQFICFKIIYSFRSIKQFGNVTKFLLGQPLGHVKGAPRKDRGHKDRLDSIFPRQNHLFYGVEMTALTKVLYCFITFFDEL